jgi:hypothetical protein
MRSPFPVALALLALTPLAHALEPSPGWVEPDHNKIGVGKRIGDVPIVPKAKRGKIYLIKPIGHPTGKPNTKIRALRIR